MTDDKRPVALITGCSSGIGLGCARLFARRGFRVYASMRRPETGEALLAEAAAAGWALTIPAMDVSSDASVNAAVGGLLRETGDRIDVVVNNAGFYLFGPLEQTTPQELAAQLDTNLLGILRVCRAVLPAMRARRSGAIVNISSLTGLNPLPVVGPYQISKAAVESLTETLRFELLPFGIRVTCIEPGTFKTDLHHKETQTAESRGADSPYAAQIAAYRAALAQQSRASLEPVLEAVFRAATAKNPKLRWPVGPLSFLGGYLKRFTPDRIYEWAIRWKFRLPPFG